MVVTLTNINHTFPDDIDVLLVGPGGQKSLLMSDAGGSVDLNNVSLTFEDAAANFLSDTSTISTGTYKPTEYDAGSDVFPAPAPAGPHTAGLAVFNGTSPQGNWQLYVRDDVGGDSGLISGGWNLQITLQPLVTVVDTLPAGVAFDSFVGLNWSCSPNGQLVTCTYNTNLPALVQASTLSIIADMPLTSGLYVNQATVSSPLQDPNPNNNSSQWGVTVNAAPSALDDAYNMGMNTTLVIGAPGVLANDSDPEGQPISASMVNQPSHGTAVINPNGSFSYTPNLGYTGVDNFFYQVSDGFWTDNAQVTINIIGAKLFLPLVRR